MDKYGNKSESIVESLSTEKNNKEFNKPEKDINVRSLLWTKIGIFITILGAIITIAFGLVPFANNTSICYEEISSLPLVNINSEKDKVAVLFDNKKVDNPRLVLLKITNNGFKEICDNMYMTNLHITFNLDSYIVSSEIYDATSLLKDYIVNNNIHPSIKDNSVEIPKLDLNRNESIYIKIVVGNYKEYSIGGRIKGVSSINQRIDNRVENFLVNNIGIIILILWIILFLRFIFNFIKINKLNDKIKKIELNQQVNMMILAGFFKDLEKNKPELMNRVNKGYGEFMASKDKVTECFIESLDTGDKKNKELVDKIKTRLMDKFKS
ncbi:hypothetical protein [Clostridium tagluense]|uniref:hypothetical protein n=1 Tax=Clostridium tagluense TaxID=360422 RepID=UPI001C6E71BA|nr:hypothetical protein [Clostridium tagluense]MBW9157674.1 hypothetical protein [Clostridium tagluense]WLC67035.1 hypothetical protein KTC93_07585 [Clostridium tagluense]